MVENRSGYDTGDLRRFLRRGLVALGVRERTHVVVVASPIRSRGCAQIGSVRREGRIVVVSMASPSRFSLRRLARLLEHEIAHKKGADHRDMNERTMYSLGDVPRWARGTRIRYRGRAPDQVD